MLTLQPTVTGCYTKDSEVSRYKTDLRERVRDWTDPRERQQTIFITKVNFMVLLNIIISLSFVFATEACMCPYS
jgi:hypothetical protein